MPKGSYSKQLTEEQKTQILKMYVEEKMPLTLLRSKLKMSIKRVRDFLIEEGEFRSPEASYKLKNEAIKLSFTDAERQDIVTKFKRGVRVLAITKEYQCTYIPIYTLLLDEGIDLMETYLRTSKPVQRLIERRAKK